MKGICRRQSQPGCGSSLHTVDIIQGAGPTQSRRRHRFTPCITQGLIFFLLPPWLSSCTGGWRVWVSPCPTLLHCNLLLYIVISCYICCACEGRLGVISTAQHLSLGRVLTVSQGPCMAPTLVQDGLIPSHWSPKAFVLCPPEHAQQRCDTAYCPPRTRQCLVTQSSSMPHVFAGGWSHSALASWATRRGCYGGYTLWHKARRAATILCSWRSTTSRDETSYHHKEQPKPPLSWPEAPRQVVGSQPRAFRALHPPRDTAAL